MKEERLDGELIDRMRDDFLQRSRNITGFDALVDVWFRGDRVRMERNRLAYSRSIRELARVANLRYLDGVFYTFDGRIYVPVSEGEIQQAFQRFIEEVYIPDMFLTKGEGMRQFQQNFLGEIRYRKILRPRFDIVAFQNGVLDMRDDSFQDFDPAFQCVDIKPFEYNRNAKCEKWLSFLHEVLPDKNSRIILQMFLGLGLIERKTVFAPFVEKDDAKIEVCLIMIGRGANGKSVIYQTAMGIFGRQRISNADYDELTSAGDEGMRARRLLRNSVFNWASENDSTTFGKRDGVFKKIVSGEPVTDRKIGGNVEQNLNMPYLVFSLNETPKIAGYADVRRLQILNFGISIPEARQNKSLAYELSKEYPGIFNWIVRGAKEIRRRKFRFPKSEGGLKQELIMGLKKNPTVAWAAAYGLRNCAPGPLLLLPSKRLYESLSAFCQLNGVPCPSVKEFGNTMGKTGREHLDFEKERRAEGIFYYIYGIAEKDLDNPFQVETEVISIAYKKERGTFIEEED